MNYSISGRLADKFQANPITPLIALAAVLLGLFAVFVTPREEEPQIDLTFANIYIALPGSSAKEIENLIAYPAEQILDAIADVKHVYSISRPGMAIISVQFKVGIKRNDAILRLYNEIYSNADWLPPSLGASAPLIKPMGIEDVPIVTVTFWTDNPNKGSFELQQVSHAIEAEIKRIPETRIVKTTGGPEQVVHILLNPEDLSAYNLDFATIENALKMSNMATNSGFRTTNNQTIPVDTGTLLANIDDIKDLVVSVKDGRPVYLTDIATITNGADSPENYVWMTAGKAWQGQERPNFAPAVTLAIGKKPGSNAVNIADTVIKVTQQLKATHIPADVHVEITRNYGKTADDKAKKLMTKLAFATLSVVLLIMIFLGWKEAIVVGLAVSITLAVTLFASWAYGFTLNRVSLFALIFSIGILVDDAVVIVENIHRHITLGKHKLAKLIPIAVDEVGSPTILATFTVIAALMPMAFVSGLMGPYMSPIPINASMGMLLSLLIALIITPWLFRKIIGDKIHHSNNKKNSKSIFYTLMQPFLINNKTGKINRYLLVFGVVLLMFISVMLVPAQKVILKMLPFDNKSEIQIVIDTKEGTTLETTNQIMLEISKYLTAIPEIKHMVAYAGTSSPINFNGLVRQYFLREGANVGDIQITLVDKYERDRQSHEIAIAIREEITKIANSHNALAKIVEVPPGPPVQSPIVAEVYGQSDALRNATALKIEQYFHQANGIVDIDTSVETNSLREIIVIDKAKASQFGISQAQIAKTIKTALQGNDVSYLHNPHNKYSIPIRIELPANIQNSMEAILNIPIISNTGNSVLLDEVVTIKPANWQKTIYHKDLLPVTFVTADMAGFQDSPLYGMLELIDIIDEQGTIQQNYITAPQFVTQPTIKWDGEWQITYETFRDMGIAYGVGLILIYLLIVAQFGSYFVPLIIMAPIPLTIIGVMPGHWLTGSQFTATSMIGMIALAGIIVRNSILLVDFISMQVKNGMELKTAVIDSAKVRAKPIILTGVAAMMGAFFILDDPIFNGLAISLISGILVSTTLTLILIPVLYFWYLSRFGIKNR
ncbi:MAG: efflux RND transporter permease subunit [Proteobacteria bacterium]|nr:efflux RND transporter permease subunit [Pseudomonadota bacterium]